MGFCFFLPSQLPFHNPNETEEQIGDGNQEVRQCQVVSGVRKADFVGSVVAVEKIGLLQEALQSVDGTMSKETIFVFRSTDWVESRLTPPDNRSAMCSWKMTKPRRALLGYWLHLLPTGKS